MNDHTLDRIEVKLDAHTEKLTEYAIQMAAMQRDTAENTANLVEHMRRTALLEARVEPIEEHVQDVKKFFKRALWICGSVLSIAGPLFNHLIEKFIK